MYMAAGALYFLESTIFKIFFLMLLYSPLYDSHFILPVYFVLVPHLICYNLEIETFF